MGYKVVVIRYLMFYGDFRKQVVQCFVIFEDFDKYECIIEEREEYELYIECGMVVYVGVDYEKILREVEKEVDIIFWDGGNNDFLFYELDFWIVVIDLYRFGYEFKYYLGEINFRVVDVIIINKIDIVNCDDIQKVCESIEKVNLNVIVIEVVLLIFVDKFEFIKGKCVLVVEDGLIFIYGGMKYGVGYVVVKKFGVVEIIDLRFYVVGFIIEIYKKYLYFDVIFFVMGYGKKQIKEFEEIINCVDVDVVIMGILVDFCRFMNFNKLVVRVKYEFEEIGQFKFKEVFEEWVKNCEKFKK